MFHPRNIYYLRISRNTIIPLFLYLDERHTDWMSDVVLQHVLADLRPLVIPKFQAEKDVHLRPGVGSGVNKRGIVEVHRGETYQFAYFFRKTEPHTVLSKSRHFHATPSSGVVPEPASPRPMDPNSDSGTVALRPEASEKQSERKRAMSEGGTKVSQKRLHEDEWSADEDEGDADDATPTPREPVRKQRRITDAYHQSDAEGLCRDFVMNSPPETDSEDITVVDGSDAWDASDLRSLSPSIANIELAVEEEERKPKPLLKLKYQSFPISGHCLCVVVEPWPHLHAVTKLHSETGLGTSLHRGDLTSPHLMSHGPVIAGQRARTPLFLSEYDEAPTGAPFARETIIPSLSSFHDTVSRTRSNDSSGDLMNFSQILNTAGHMHAITAEDDDDMDGFVLFGDADEIRELS